MPELESDSLLFYRAVQQADDLWAEVSAFRFSAVSYRRRGEDYALSPVLLEGAEVSWRYLTALRRLQAETRYVAGARPQVGRLSVGAGATAVSLTEYDPMPGGALALRAATRNYRAGAEGSLAFELPRRWHLAVTVDGRFGLRCARRRRLYAADDGRPARRPPHEGRRILDGGVRRAVYRARFTFLFGEGGVYAAGFQLLQSRMGASGGRCA